MIRAWLAVSLVALAVLTTTVVAPQFIGRYDWLLLFTIPWLVLSFATLVKLRQTFQLVSKLPPRSVVALPPPSAGTPAIIRYGTFLALAGFVAATWWLEHQYPAGGVVKKAAGIQWVEGEQTRPATLAELHGYNAASLRMVSGFWLLTSLFCVWLLHVHRSRYDFLLTESQCKRRGAARDAVVEHH